MAVEPFAEPEDLENRFDSRTIRDLLLDNGEAATDVANNNNRVMAALMDATGAIISACQVGRMYSEEDLETLVTASGTDGSLIKRLTCELAMMYLIEARPEKFKGQYSELTKRTEGYLDRFRKGERVFSIEGQLAAGVVSHDGLDRYEYQIHGNWIPDRMRGYYPARALPFGR